MKQEVIAFCGERETGKNTAAILFATRWGFVELSFAHALKDIASRALELPYAQFHDQDKKEVAFNGPLFITKAGVDRIVVIGQEYGSISSEQADAISRALLGRGFITPRDVLQFLGTEVFRQCVRESFWTDALLKQMEGQSKVAITDCRFPNERSFVRSLGGKLVRIKRATGKSLHTHASERSLGDDKEYDVVIENNSDIDEFYEKLGRWYAARQAMAKIAL
jgi:hypothetical protein